MPVFDLTQLSDEDLRAALFDALVERLDAKALEDPSIVVVNRMPAAFAVSRRGTLLTLTQGLGLRLLRGDLKWQNHRERPRTFSVDRGTIQSRLAIMPDRTEGTPGEILDRIVAMFLGWTATAEEGRPVAAEPIRENWSRLFPAAQMSRPLSRLVAEQSQPTAPVPQSGPTRPEAAEERRGTSAGSAQGRQPAALRTIRETSASAEVRPGNQPALQIAGTQSKAEGAPPRPAPIGQTTPFRTYQLLFETTRRELDRAERLPVSGRYSLIGAGVFVALTAEAFFNDLGSRVIPSWSQLQRLDPREKAEVLSIELFNVKVDWSSRPFQSVAAALGFKRALAHAHAETLSFDQARTADRPENEVPRTRQTAWQEHCEVATIQRWITDVRLVIEHFSKAHDPTDVAIGRVEQPSVSSSSDALMPKSTD